MAENKSLKGKDASSVVTILLPALFAVILLVLVITTAFFLPRLIKKNNACRRSDDQKRRMMNLERACKTQAFNAWCAKHEEAHPEYKSEIMTCVICLEQIEDKEKVRALDCNHVFHQHCLDDWYCRWNEFCPLCHRSILPHYVSIKKSPKSFVSRSSVDAEHDGLAVMV
ncbi:hypothetical protein IWX90DRAFT_247688 [Phyllosticta citrichinensis]|uniref:RING-type domain-containing protein n=1 Tax=Phyllosticta citrichinensis TaxID=1130410 RepID=A0ABR1XQZ2_9PEZI